MDFFFALVNQKKAFGCIFLIALYPYGNNARCCDEKRRNNVAGILSVMEWVANKTFSCERYYFGEALRQWE